MKSDSSNMVAAVPRQSRNTSRRVIKLMTPRKNGSPVSDEVPNRLLTGDKKQPARHHDALSPPCNQLQLYARPNAKTYPVHCSNAETTRTIIREHDVQLLQIGLKQKQERGLL